jgi:pimeloyl-ACP methyl ester carboxylesterase
MIRVLALSVVALVASGTGASTSYDAYYGNYSVAPDHQVGIDRFITDSGEDSVLIADYSSGVVRRLFPVSETEFVMGPGFDVQSPVELKVHFVKDATGAVTSFSLEPTNGVASVAHRMGLTEQQVVIESGDVKLAGTLMVPATKGPHPAIVLLHGSGPLTRYSFGPYPRFFTSLGFAVLIYDKRGTGASTGTRLDPSMGRYASRPPDHYPDDVLRDALAVLGFLRQRPEIDPKVVGVWGSSEGGMLTTQVAARDKDLAFAINSSGFMGPLSQTLLYQIGTLMKAGGASAEQVKEAQQLATLWIRVSRSGRDFEKFRVELDKARKEKKPWVDIWFNGQFTPEQIRWDWNHIASFDSLPALKKVTCPVLGVFGELDPMTDAAEASRAMQSALTAAGNRDVTVRVFPNAGHSLGEMPSGSRMAPGVFETLRSWLLMHVQTVAPL